MGGRDSLLFAGPLPSTGDLQLVEEQGSVAYVADIKKSLPALRLRPQALQQEERRVEWRRSSCPGSSSQAPGRATCRSPPVFHTTATTTNSTSQPYSKLSHHGRTEHGAAASPLAASRWPGSPRALSARSLLSSTSPSASTRATPPLPPHNAPGSPSVPHRAGQATAGVSGSPRPHARSAGSAGVSSPARPTTTPAPPSLRASVLPPGVTHPLHPHPLGPPTSAPIPLPKPPAFAGLAASRLLPLPPPPPPIPRRFQPSCPGSPVNPSAAATPTAPTPPCFASPASSASRDAAVITLPALPPPPPQLPPLALNPDAASLPRPPPQDGAHVHGSGPADAVDAQRLRRSRLHATASSSALSPASTPPHSPRRAALSARSAMSPGPSRHSTSSPGCEPPSADASAGGGGLERGGSPGRAAGCGRGEAAASPRRCGRRSLSPARPLQPLAAWQQQQQHGEDGAFSLATPFAAAFPPALAALRTGTQPGCGPGGGGRGGGGGEDSQPLTPTRSCPQPDSPHAHAHAHALSTPRAGGPPPPAPPPASPAGSFASSLAPAKSLVPAASVLTPAAPHPRPAAPPRRLSRAALLLGHWLARALLLTYYGAIIATDASAWYGRTYWQQQQYYRYYHALVYGAFPGHSYGSGGRAGHGHMLMSGGVEVSTRMRALLSAAVADGSSAVPLALHLAIAVLCVAVLAAGRGFAVPAALLAARLAADLLWQHWRGLLLFWRGETVNLLRFKELALVGATLVTLARGAAPPPPAPPPPAPLAAGISPGPLSRLRAGGGAGGGGCRASSAGSIPAAPGTPATPGRFASGGGGALAAQGAGPAGLAAPAALRPQRRATVSDLPTQPAAPPPGTPPRAWLSAPAPSPPASPSPLSPAPSLTPPGAASCAAPGLVAAPPPAPPPAWHGVALRCGVVLMAPLFAYYAHVQVDAARLAPGSGPLAALAELLGAGSRWVPPGDGSAGTFWLPAQAALALPAAMGGRGQRWLTAGLAVAVAAEGALCWRFWVPKRVLWSYTLYVCRHFLANMAIAAGLLMTLPGAQLGGGGGEWTRGSAVAKKSR